MSEAQKIVVLTQSELEGVIKRAVTEEDELKKMVVFDSEYF